MMDVVHITAECYPAAKAGGLGDVAGALPKYINRLGHRASVILPHYRTDWLLKAEIELLYQDRAPFGNSSFAYRVNKVVKPDLGFDLILIDIPTRFDRPGIYLDPFSGYPYWDEKERFFSFQIAALEWIMNLEKKPDILHVHDHHTGLVPFMTAHCHRYDSLHNLPTVLTIHNAEYQGRYEMKDAALLPAFDFSKHGLLDWGGQLNALATGIKTAWKVTTVSEGYLQELKEYCHGLESLLLQESQKSLGIINGIDTEVWDPEKDPLLHENYSLRRYKSGKEKNKKALLKQFGLQQNRPLISFIGRLVREKGADLLPDLIRRCYHENIEVTFLILGTGDPALHHQFENLQNEYLGYFDSRLEYNEALAHQIYAGSDFIIMPSRVEPCGLNQMYAMRYGTIPIVRKIGGLADSVVDLSQEDGYGIMFDNFTLEDAVEAIRRAAKLYSSTQEFNKKRRAVMNLDFSWNTSANNYLDMYRSMT